MTTEDTKIASKVYDRTSLYACLCFDNAQEIQKAQQFVCVLLKRGVIMFPEDADDQSNNKTSDNDRKDVQESEHSSTTD
jgi:hypothetical protein